SGRRDEIRLESACWFSTSNAAVTKLPHRVSARTNAAPRSPSKRPSRRRAGPSKSSVSAVFGGLLLLVAVIAGLGVVFLRERYTFSLQSPVRIHFQWPFVVAAKTAGEDAAEAQADQFGRRLTAYQQYACNKFGSECRVALA